MMPHSEAEVRRPTLFFAIVQFLVGVALIVEDSIAYGMYDFDVAYNITARGAGFWSGSVLILSAGFGLYGLTGPYKRCPVITSTVFSLIAATDGLYAFCVFLYLITTSADREWEAFTNTIVAIPFDFTIIHLILYFGMCSASIGQAVVCIKHCCANRHLVPPGESVQYIMAPTGGQQPVQVMYHQPGQQMYK